MSKRWIRLILSPILIPISWVYGFIVFVRNKLFDLKILRSVKFDIPVISVGNITVGGTGKTPHVEYLLGLLSSDHKTAMLSRGYKRKTHGFLMANSNTQPRDIGDEPFQILSKFSNITVAVDSHRVNGIEQLKKTISDLQAVVLDDAFQHRYVKPRISIALVDYSRPVFKDYLLPFGCLRERMSALRRADIIIVSKVPENAYTDETLVWKKNLKLHAQQPLYFTTYEYSELIPVFNSNIQKMKLNDLENKASAVILVTGIANPKPLAEKIRSLGIEIIQLQYSDHREYTQKDMSDIEKKFLSIENINKIIVTTEKDAVKLRQFKDLTSTIKEKMYYMPIHVKFLYGKKEEFDRRIVEKVNS
jgi:tetraacyldisaccharide 4'-kinase